MKQTLLTFYLFLIGSVLPLAGQRTALVHINQPFYVSGEVIWYKLYLPVDFPAGPKVITVSLFDRSGKVIDQSYLRRREEAAVFGYYKIPYEWTSDSYRLVFSATEEEKHRPIVLTEVFVPIYNDFLEEGTAAETIPGRFAPTTPQKNEPEDLQIEIHTDQDSYTPRSTAMLRIKITNKNGEPLPATFSVSVSDQQLFQVEHSLFPTIHEGKKLPVLPPLEENITLRGTTFAPGGQSILPKGNIGAYLINQQQFIYAKADEAGHFTLDLPDIYGDCPIHVGGFLPEDLWVTFDRQMDLSTPTLQDLPYPPQVIRYQKWSRRRKLIYQLYGRLESNFTATFPPAEESVKESDSRIVLDEYDAFPDIPTLVKDLLAPIRFRPRKNDIYEARIFDPTVSNRKFHTNGPLFIVDGKLTRDADYIARLDIAKIERFDLYFDFDRGLRLFGPMARNGLVMIQSRNRDIDVPEPDRKNFFTITGFQAGVDYPVQTRQAEESEVLLRPALFWDPSVTTNDLGEARLSIPLSDDHTRFRVEVVAQGLDGKRGRGEVYFRVEKTGE